MPVNETRPQPIGDRVFAGAIPDIYERLLVPLIFAPFAADMAARVAALAPRRILETAAGTGAVTRRLAAALPPDVEIVATDLNPAMLEIGARGLADPRLRWQQADALALPFEDGAFDAVLCQFGIMFFPDRRRGYAEARRVLAPGGTFLAYVWDALAANPLPAAITEELAALFPHDPPRFFARTPYAHASLDRLRDEMEAVGLADFGAAAVRRTGWTPSAEAAAVAFCQGTPVRGEIEQRAAGRLDGVTAQVARGLVRRFGGGPFETPLRALVVTARR